VPTNEAVPSPRLGHLLKQAQFRFTGLTTAALAPLGIMPMEWAALLRFDDQRLLSQAAVAQQLGIDRTTMVGLVDELERKGLVQRRPHSEDRRKNVVELTVAGRTLKQRAAEKVDECEREFLSALSKADAQQFRAALQTVIAPIQ
jgi:DNA-binding MarR family transcriptional regulator